MSLPLAVRFEAVGLLEYQNRVRSFREVLFDVVRSQRLQVRRPLPRHSLLVVCELFGLDYLTNLAFYSVAAMNSLSERA